MTEIQFLTSTQEALIPEYQEKWQRIYLSVQPIERIRAKAAIQGAYAVMGKAEPAVMYCTSPRAALDFLRDIGPFAAPPTDENSSSEEINNNSFQFIAENAWNLLDILAKQQFGKIKPLQDLKKEISNEVSKFVEEKIARGLPQDLTTEDTVEQTITSLSPLLVAIQQEQIRRGYLELPQMIGDLGCNNLPDFFRESASVIETQFAWFPAKGWLLRESLSKMLGFALFAKISGLGWAKPQLQETISFSLSAAEQKVKMSLAGSTIVISDFILECTFFDFVFSVLHAPTPTPKWLALQGLAKYCGWIFAVDSFCLVCDRPTKILLDENNFLHGEGEPAIEFADGFTAYAYRNIPIPEQYGRIRPNEWQSQWVLAEKRSTVQKALIQGIGAVRLCQELPTVELGSQSEYSLVKIENVGIETIYILKRIDPETGNIRAVIVPQSTSVSSAIEYTQRNVSSEVF